MGWSRYGYKGMMQDGFWLWTAEEWFKRGREDNMWWSLFLAVEAGEI